MRYLYFGFIHMKYINLLMIFFFLSFFVSCIPPQTIEKQKNHTKTTTSAPLKKQLIDKKKDQKPHRFKKTAPLKTKTRKKYQKREKIEKGSPINVQTIDNYQKRKKNKKAPYSKTQTINKHKKRERIKKSSVSLKNQSVGKYAQRKKIKETIKIPSWFIQKPEISGLNLSYAYSSSFNDKEKELTELLKNAARNIQISKKTRMIILQTAVIQSQGTTGCNRVIECDVSIDMKSLTDNYTILNKYPIGKGILAIAAETSQLKKYSAFKINNILKVVDISSPPKWAIEPPKRKGYFFGIGLAPAYSSPEKAWMIAEQNARADIALQLKIKIRVDTNTNQASDFGYQEEHEKAWASYSLKNVSIIKHGYCKPEKTFYALARMKKIGS